MTTGPTASKDLALRGFHACWEEAVRAPDARSAWLPVAAAARLARLAPGGPEVLRGLPPLPTHGGWDEAIADVVGDARRVHRLLTRRGMTWHDAAGMGPWRREGLGRAALARARLEGARWLAEDAPLLKGVAAPGLPAEKAESIADLALDLDKVFGRSVRCLEDALDAGFRFDPPPAAVRVARCEVGRSWWTWILEGAEIDAQARAWDRLAPAARSDLLGRLVPPSPRSTEGWHPEVLALAGRRPASQANETAAEAGADPVDVILDRIARLRVRTEAEPLGPLDLLRTRDQIAAQERRARRFLGDRPGEPGMPWDPATFLDGTARWLADLGGGPLPREGRERGADPPPAGPWLCGSTRTCARLAFQADDAPDESADLWLSPRGTIALSRYGGALVLEWVPDLGPDPVAVEEDGVPAAAFRERADAWALAEGASRATVRWADGLDVELAL